MAAAVLVEDIDAAVSTTDCQQRLLLGGRLPRPVQRAWRTVRRLQLKYRLREEFDDGRSFTQSRDRVGRSCLRTSVNLGAARHADRGNFKEDGPFYFKQILHIGTISLWFPYPNGFVVICYTGCYAN